MYRKTLNTRFYLILVFGLLLAAWPSISVHHLITIERIEDRYTEIALYFTHATYVKDWDGSPERFHQTLRDGDGSYSLQNKYLESSKSFNILARTGWKLYFNEVGPSSQLPQDAQILTGSKLESGCEITFVVAIRGSDKPKDYLFTNLKNDPITLEHLGSFEQSREKESLRSIISPFLNIAKIIYNPLFVWSSRMLPASPVFLHKGYAEQAGYALQAKAVDPVDGNCLTIKEALNKYPGAEFIIVGHSSGGGSAQALAVFLEEMGLNRLNRIRVRTFATAGAFNLPGQSKYKGFDSITYFIPEDPILVANNLSGYGPIGVSIALPTTRKISNYSTTIHEMTAYEERLITDIRRASY